MLPALRICPVLYGKDVWAMGCAWDAVGAYGGKPCCCYWTTRGRKHGPSCAPICMLAGNMHNAKDEEGSEQ
jgi:hypothetical protein